jgi:hypothetical protein
MDALRTEMGSVADTPASDNLRVSFDRLHRISVDLELAVLASGVVAMVFTSRVPKPAP